MAKPVFKAIDFGVSPFPSRTVHGLNSKLDTWAFKGLKSCPVHELEKSKFRARRHIEYFNAGIFVIPT